MKTTTIALITLLTVASLSPLCAQQSATAPSDTQANIIHDFSELEVKPKPIKRVPPLYPAELKANKISGEAVVSFVVDTDGTVKNIRVERTTEQAFGEAAVAAVAAWKFEPGSIKGTPVPCLLSLPLVFSVQK